MAKELNITQEETKYTSPAFEVVQRQITLGTGETLTRDLVKHPPVVVVLAEIDGCVVMTKEYRTGKNAVTYGLIAGYRDENETAKDAALRELEEEAGIHIKKAEVKILGRPVYSSEGFTDEQVTVVHIKFGKGDFTTSTQTLDKDEYVTPYLISLPVADIMVDHEACSGIASAYALELLRAVKSRNLFGRALTNYNHRKTYKRFFHSDAFFDDEEALAVARKTQLELNTVHYHKGDLT